MSRKLFSRRASRRSGFTLIEALMAIALMGGLLAAAVAVLFQVSAAWSTQAEDPLIDRHVDGLDRFIRRVFAESGSSGVGTPNSQQIADQGAFLTVVPPADLPWIEPLAREGGAIEGRFAIPKEGGLWLYWNTATERSKGTLGNNGSHRVQLSPWVVSAQVFNYDGTNSVWAEVQPDGTSAVSATAATSRVLRIQISHLGQNRMIQIPVPRNAT